MTDVDIWGRQFHLNIVYDCFDGEDILDNQKIAVQNLVNAQSAIFDAKKKVEAYCLSKNQEEIGSNHIDNIFKYVMPKYLFVRRTEEKRMVAIMCDDRFDMEHGIAIVFENEVCVSVGKQDIIL